MAPIWCSAAVVLRQRTLERRVRERGRSAAREQVLSTAIAGCGGAGLGSSSDLKKPQSIVIDIGFETRSCDYK